MRRKPSERSSERAVDDEELVMTHAIVGTSGELVGVMLVSRNLAQLSRVQHWLARGSSSRSTV